MSKILRTLSILAPLIFLNDINISIPKSNNVAVTQYEAVIYCALFLAALPISQARLRLHRRGEIGVKEVSTLLLSSCND